MHVLCDHQTNTPATLYHHINEITHVEVFFINKHLFSRNDGPSSQKCMLTAALQGCICYLQTLPKLVDGVDHAFINTHDFHVMEGNIFLFIVSVTFIISVDHVISSEVPFTK